MLRVVVAFLLLLALLPSAAHAEKRVALLIGNQTYKPGVGALVNPLNDVRVVGEALKARVRSTEAGPQRAPSRYAAGDPRLRSQS
jgi:hypothetical protein